MIISFVGVIISFSYYEYVVLIMEEESGMMGNAVLGR